MGNLYKKNCTAAGVTTFIVDPFGLHGISNVIGQVRYVSYCLKLEM